MEETIRLVRPGVSELDLAAEIGLQNATQGGFRGSFEAIVAAGPRSALPHARPTSRQIGRNELVVLDLGAILRRYCKRSHSHRLRGTAPLACPQVVSGRPGCADCGAGRCKAGVSTGAVDAAARGLLQRKGWGALLCP